MWAFGSFRAEDTEPYFQLASGVVIIGMALWMLGRARADLRAAHNHDHHHGDHHHGHHHHDHGHAHQATTTPRKKPAKRPSTSSNWPPAAMSMPMKPPMPRISANALPGDLSPLARS
jgi:ABC-type nickel/cobalt efflux system permease component RcnA